MSEPLSILLLVQQVPAGGKHVRVAADETQRRAIAGALRIEGVEALTAELVVRPIGAEAYSVRGEIAAAVVQTDVVTLDPVRQEVTEPIDLTLVPEATESARGKRSAPPTGHEETDERDIYHSGRIDIGAIVLEHLALALDPYPRAADTEFSGHTEDDPATAPSAFAGLAALKRNKGQEPR
jgi:uncharacterized metal-binding protein YceD (DUF177 family)